MRSTAPRKLDDWLGRSHQWPKIFFNELNRNMKNFHNFAINTLKVYPYILLKYIFERLWCIQRIYWKLPLGEYENSESSEISETSETSDKMRWCPSFPSSPSFSFEFSFYTIENGVCLRKFGKLAKLANIGQNEMLSEISELSELSVPSFRFTL